MGWGTGLLALAAFLGPAVAAGRMPHNPGSDRIEHFPWVNQFHGRDEATRDCTLDGIWCAELVFPRAERAYEIRITARPTNRTGAERRWRYVIPVARCCERNGDGISLWQQIVRRWATPLPARLAAARLRGYLEP